jgi:hypothetical protein
MEKPMSINLHDPIGHIEQQARFSTRDIADLRANHHNVNNELGLFVATLVNPESGIDWDAVPPNTREAIAPWLDALEEAGYLQPYIEAGAADPRLQPMEG